MNQRASLFPLVLGLLVVSLSSCLPIPLLPGDTSETRLNVSDSVPDVIVIGTTTRADVLLALGEPDGASRNGERFIYTRVSRKGGMAFVGAAGGGVTGGAAARMVYRRLIVTFDSAGIVESARVHSVSCWEKALAAYSSPPCAGVRGYDLISTDLLHVEADAEVNIFPGLYRYPGIHGFETMRKSRSWLSSKGFDEFRVHALGSLVVGLSYVYFFPPDADRETLPSLRIPYHEITDVYVDSAPFNKEIKVIVIRRTNGEYESFGGWDPIRGDVPAAKAVETAARMLESYWRSATSAE